MVLVFGLPGTGKTTLARKLSKVLGCVRISTEEVRAILCEETKVRLDKDFSENELRRAYAVVFYIADLLLSNGIPVILDGVFRSELQRRSAKRVARQSGAPMLCVMTTCSSATAKRRLKMRKERGTVSPAGPKTYDLLKKEFERPRGEVVIVATEATEWA